MMHTNRFKLSPLVLLILALLLSAAVQAENDQFDWPCIQVLLPEVEMAVVWPEPLEESQRGLWREDNAISSLAEVLGDLSSYGENEQQLIEDFVAAQAPAKLGYSLGRLADGVLSVANRVRSQHISGIRRYTRQQIAMAEQIQQQLNQLAAMEQGTQQEQMLEIKESLAWQERIFDQRERAITALCERPVALQENLSSVMRKLAQHLP